MRHFTRVKTITEYNYVVGNNWTDDTTITDITIDYENLPLEIEIWAAKVGTSDEKWVAAIPYHAVELLVK
jgi:hypothetical protein